MISMITWKIASAQLIRTKALEPAQAELPSLFSGHSKPNHSVQLKIQLKRYIMQITTRSQLIAKTT